MEELRQDYRIQSVTVSKIDNGYLVSKSYYHTVKDKEQWDEDRYYCEDLDQVKVKLEEIYK